MASIADDNVHACTTEGEAGPEYCEAWKRVLERQKTMTAEELTIFAARRADDAARYGARKKLRQTAHWREASEGSRRDMETQTLQELMAARQVLLPMCRSVLLTRFRDKKGKSAAAKRAMLSADSETILDQTTTMQGITEEPPEDQKTDIATRVDDAISQICNETPRSECSGEIAVQDSLQTLGGTTEFKRLDELQEILSRVVASRDLHRQRLKKEADVQQRLRTQLQSEAEIQETLRVRLQHEKQAREDAELRLVKLTSVVSRLEDHLTQLLETYIDTVEA